MWTDVISALATGFAAIVALILGAYSLQVALKERRDRIKRESEEQVRQHEILMSERRSQAERVTCWMAADNNAYPVNWIIVDNASEQPVWDVKVSHELLPSGVASIPVIPANERYRIDVDSKGVLRPAQIVRVSFRDNRARRWRRSGELGGFLSEERLS
ncbi:hypothetical protein LJR013_003177 [Pseudarthrobacter oxydans]|uniref:hypothetical protein n=1 Tax=Pseudarthrobacter oxydans TaxID=1671 RepID=UPI003ECC2256